MLKCPQCGRQFDAGVESCPEDGAPLRADPTLRADGGADRGPLAGVVLDDKYRLDARLGEGGMGTVYRATHLLIDRPVAVKVLNARLVTDEAARERFRREARAAGRLRHTNAVAVTDFGETGDGLVYIVMELLEGHPLRDVLAREAPLDPARAVSMMLQVAAAVAVAHESGIIHRDLKPGNIFLVQRPHAPHIVKVLDFGIAKLGADSADAGPNPVDTLTGTGVMIGTPRYMSPEQCDGAALTPASDVYSMGVILYEMLTGQTPFSGATPLAVALKHSSETPRAPRELAASIPPALESLTLHALEKSPEDRPADAGEFRRELYGVAERLGFEHSAGFSAPTIETLRDAGTETPSGRLVIDIERLRQNRATAQLTGETAVSTTSEGESPSTGGGHGPGAPRGAPAAAGRLRVPLRRGGQSWAAWLREPPVIVALVLVACLLGGALFLSRSPARRAALTGQGGEGESEEALGRELTPAGTAPRADAFSEPRTAAEFYQNGTYYFSIRSYDAAVRDLRRAIELQPDFPSAYNRLGRAYVLKGQFPEAAAAFRTAIEQRGGRYPTAQYNLGFALQSRGDAGAAAEAYRGAIESRGGIYPDAYFQLGGIYLGSPDRAREAADAFRKAIEQNDGRDPEAHFKLGVALAQQKDYAGAESAFREAVSQRGGDFAYAHYNLGLVYQTTGRTNEAVREFETFLEQAPRGEDNRESRRRAENTLRDLRRRAAREGDTQP